MDKLRVILLLLVGFLPAWLSMSAQSLTVTGTVNDKEGEPVIGATVRVDNSSAATATDIDGNFTLRVAKYPAAITVTSVGYQTKKVTISSAAPVKIELAEDSEMLDEVVVIGYGTVRKADLAGSVSVVDSKAFSAQPVTTVGEALQGRVSGVNVISGGVPGAAPKIRIRGANSINKSNEPLYVVDGLVRESGLEGINPEDIASMQILKDASSTAIYGSRGANGVVLITTRRGKTGSAEITFDASLGWSDVYHMPKVMSTQKYAEALVNPYPNPYFVPQYNEAGEITNGDMANLPFGASLTNTEYITPYLDGSDPGVDWLDQLFRTGMTQNYKLSYTKGNEQIQTYFSANYMNDKGVIDYSSYERFAARANVHAKVTPWLETTVDVDMSHGVGHGVGGFEMGVGPIWGAYTFSPTMSLLNEAGAYNLDPINSAMANSPYSTITSANERRRDILNGRVDLKFNICKGLTFTTSNGVDYANMYTYSFSDTKRIPGATSSMANSNTNRWLLQSTNNFTYMKNWESGHALTATAVWEATSSTTRNMSIGGKNLLTESVGWWNVGVADTQTAGNGFSKWTLMSAVARAIYSWKDRYMLTATFRADGSSRLSNNKWAYFPSVAVAWTATNEPFMKNVSPSTLSNLKVRASWGIIGNQDISPYQTMTLLSSAVAYYGTNTAYPGYWSDTMPTPDLKWEKTNQFDVGVDAGFVNGRIDVSLDWYYKRTQDALLMTTPPAYLGGKQYYVNAGEVSNTGVDLSLTAVAVQTRDWTWSTTIQASWMKNRVEKLTESDPIIFSNPASQIFDTDPIIVKEGEAIGSFYGFRWAGVDSEGYDTYYTADNEITRTPSVDDRTILGKASPDFMLGWNNTVTWKNLSLNVFFNGSFGGDRLNVLRFAMNGYLNNSKFYTAENWIDDVLSGKLTDPRVAKGNVYHGASSQWVEKADYMRLENLALSYEFKRSMTKFADIRLQVSVQNLFTITGYKGVNPAGLTYGGAEYQKGIDFGSAPATRTYSVGVRFVF